MVTVSHLDHACISYGILQIGAGGLDEPEFSAALLFNTGQCRMTIMPCVSLPSLQQAQIALSCADLICTVRLLSQSAGSKA